LGPDAIEERVSKIAISLGSERYRVLLGEGLLKQIGAYVRTHLARQTCAIITDSNVARLFRKRVRESLMSAGFKPTLIAIPAGEKSKTLKQAGTICDQMIAAGLDRQSFVIGIGGGVIGDISGFVAAIYDRAFHTSKFPPRCSPWRTAPSVGRPGSTRRRARI